MDGILARPRFTLLTVTFNCWQTLFEASPKQTRIAKSFREAAKTTTICRLRYLCFIVSTERVMRLSMSRSQNRWFIMLDRQLGIAPNSNCGSNRLRSTSFVATSTQLRGAQPTGRCFEESPHNKSLDASGGSVFLNLILPAMLE